GMYIGSTGPRGLHHLVQEIVDNSVDEALAGYCDLIEVTLLADGGVRCVDNGRGIPVAEHKIEKKSTLEVVLTVLHAGGKFGGGGYAVSGGLHGVGSSVVNALSTRLEAVVKRDGYVWRQSFAGGGAPEGPIEQGEATDETGTTITFWPDAEIFTETVEFEYEILRTRFQQMAFLNKGLKIELYDEREGATEEVDNEYGEPETRQRHEDFHYENVLMDYVDYINNARKAERVHEEIISFEYEDTDGKISAEIAMQWTTSYNDNVFTYANTINTHEGGTHEEGFRAALTSLINRYARANNLLKEKDDNLTGDDVREGLTAVVSVKLGEIGRAHV